MEAPPRTFRDKKDQRNNIQSYVPGKDKKEFRSHNTKYTNIPFFFSFFPKTKTNKKKKNKRERGT